MTKEEIKKMVNTCNNYHNCSGCPYNPKDISRFIGDRWKGGCPNYDDKLVYAMGKGYGKISEYKAEIDKLKAEFKQLETNAEILARGVRDLNQENYELTEQVKQAKIDVLNELKILIFHKDNPHNVPFEEFISANVFCGYIDELIAEVK